MKLNKMTKEELELMAYTDIAALYLEENKKTMTTADLFKEICKLLELSESEYVDKIADFFGSLTTSREFILLEDGTWDLKSNHSVKVNIDEIYEEKDELEDSEEEELEEETEPDDLDAIDNDSYIDDDNDDLADLTIVEEEELEE